MGFKNILMPGTACATSLCYEIGLVMVASALAVITGCATRSPAPVVDRQAPAAATFAPSQAPPLPSNPTEARPEYHEVQKGETLFSIAFQHGVDYREMAQWNGLDDPNVLKVGQRLRLTPPEGAPVVTGIAPAEGVVVTPLGNAESTKPVRPVTAAGPAGALKVEPKAIKQPYSEKALAQLQNPTADKTKVDTKSDPKAPEMPPTAGAATAAADGIDWVWPAKGKPKVLFTDTTKGIDIAGMRGQPVTAAAAGKVIHVGSNLRGYGKLIIIQHSSMFLSAYAHNNQVLVKEGERVAKGQKIAEMGDSDTDHVKLHFEIRRFGKPVDPLRYLPGEKS
jgi:lipoprotein NlpD